MISLKTFLIPKKIITFTAIETKYRKAKTLLMKTIIIDDEPQSHQVLKHMLTKNHPEVALLASGYSVKEGYELIHQHQPQLVFLDIEMPDGLGFDLLKKFETYDFQVIFISAHNKYAASAIGFGAVEFLEKPVDAELLKDAIQRARENFIKNLTPEQISIMMEVLHNNGLRGNLNNSQPNPKTIPPRRIAIATNEGIHYKFVKDIIRLEAHQNYTKFFFNNQKTILASHNLGHYLTLFEPYAHKFKQTHRSHLVNLEFVETLVKTDFHLIMADSSIVPVSKTYRDEITNDLARL
jgi:two-component system, LytTR family, response regulator